MYSNGVQMIPNSLLCYFAYFTNLDVHLLQTLVNMNAQWIPHCVDPGIIFPYILLKGKGKVVPMLN
jgi:hypothetical protein